jgi:WD40 repeat protein
MVLLVLASEALAQPPAEGPLPPGAVARFGTRRFWMIGDDHEGQPSALAVSPDGKTCADTGNHGHIRLWDTTANRPPRYLGNGGGGYQTLAFSADGKRLAYATPVSVGVYDLASGALLWHAPGGHFVGFLPDGTLLAFNRAQQPTLFDPATGKELRSFGGITGVVFGVVLSRDGTTLAALVISPVRGRRADDRAHIIIWDIPTGRARCTVTEGVTRDAHLSLSPDGKQLAVADGPLLLLDTATGKLVRRLKRVTDNPHVACAFAPDGKLLACVTGFEVQLLDPATGAKRGWFPSFSTARRVLSFSADGRWLVVPLGMFKIALLVCDIRPQVLARAYDGHESAVVNLRFTANGKALVSCSWYDARWWDLAQRRQTARIDFTPLASAKAYFQSDISVDGRTVVVADTGKRTQVLNAAGRPRLRFEAAGDQVRLSPDGKRFVHPDAAGVLRVRDVATGKELKQLNGHSGSPHVLAFSADGQRLLSAVPREAKEDDPDNPQPPPESVFLWDVATGKRLRSWALDANCADLAPDGRTVAVGTKQGEVVLLDAATGQGFRRWQAGPQMLRAVAFAPDGRSLAAAGHDWVVSWWEVATGQQRRRFLGHYGLVCALAFSPDGRRLASGSSDMTAIVWELHQPAGGKRTVQELWADLHGGADRFSAAVAGLRAVPADTLALIKQELQPVATVAAQPIRKRIADLDSPRFDLRDAAGRYLETCDEQAEAHLRQALQDNPAPEVRRRIEALLAKLEMKLLHPSAAEVRALRMLELLEHLGTPEARALLQELAAGAPEARRTRSARAALGRLKA